MPDRLDIPFGPYRLHELLGQGGMAEVYRARRSGFDRDIAIKRLLSQYSEDPDLSSMFVDEARLTERLDHPGIARVYEAGTIDGSLFIAMEHVDGEDLRQIVKRWKDRPLPVRFVLRVGVAVSEALAHAHQLRDQRGRRLEVVHRDISPQNILVAHDGAIKLIDFGIAKARMRIQQTQGGVVKGKFAYMSPEQIQGHKVDARSDIFSLGIVLFELLAGRSLFTADHEMAMMYKVISAEIPPLAPLNRAVPSALEQAIRRALARKPDHRFPSAAAMRDELAELAEQPGTQIITQAALGDWVARGLCPEEDEETRDYYVEPETATTMDGWPAEPSRDGTATDGGFDEAPTAYMPRPFGGHEAKTARLASSDGKLKPAVDLGGPQPQPQPAPAAPLPVRAPPPPRQLATLLWAGGLLLAACILGALTLLWPT